ncbi:Glutamate--tRNA ligase cytoplasmic [Bienertia sinuspersici]
MIMKLLYAVDNPPLSAIAAFNVAGVSISMDASLPSSTSPSLIFPEGSKIEGEYVILRYIGRTMNLYGMMIINLDRLMSACNYVDDFLSTSSYLVDSDLSIADIALWSALSRTSQRWESLRRSKKYENLVRWYNSLTYEYSSSFSQF